MKKFVVLWMLCLGTGLSAFSQVDSSYIYNPSMPYGRLDLRLAKSPTRYYYLQEDTTFSYRESAPGVKTNTYMRMNAWNTSPYGQGNLREMNGSADNFVMNYRLLKPQNYDAAYAPGYPIIIIFHGGGEAANCWIDTRCYWATDSYNPVTNSPPAPTDEFHRLLNNDRNLLHGGTQHITAVNLAGSKLPDDPTLPERAFPGFVLFPQSLNGWGPSSQVEDAIRILRLIIKKYNIDESRVYIHGLSNGGGGVYQALKRAPWLFAAALPMSAVNDGGIIAHGMVGEVAKLPIWTFQGGQDVNPTPSRTYNYVRHFRDAGADVRYYLYPHLGHGTWNTAFREPDFFSWILEKRKYNPHVYYANPVICNTTQTGVGLGFSKGFFAYQWERDGQIISGATAAEFTADTPGTYRGRFSRKPNPAEGDWERWSDPIVVTELYPEKPSVEVIGTAHLRGPGLASSEANNSVRLKASDSAALYEWYKNGSLINFSGTDVEDTLRIATFNSGSSAGNGSYTLVTKNFNCPSPPSDAVNLYFNNSSPQNLTITAEAVGFKGTVTASSIFLSWNDVSGLESGYEIWRRRAGTPDFQFVTKTSEDAVSYHDTKLDPATTYEYKLRAVNNAGRSNYVPSNDPAVNYSFTTLGDTRFPPPPQDLAVASNTLTSITFSWKAAQDESSVKGYYLYYNNDSVSTGSNATTYTLGGLTQNTAYNVKVKAVDFGNHLSQPSNQIVATTYLSGLVYKHSTGAWHSLDDSAMVATWNSPEFTGTVRNFTLQPRTQEDYFNFMFNGYLNIETEGTYYFNITSSDGSRLIIDGVVVADNDGLHGTSTVESQAVFLTAGPHTIEVQYFDDTGGHTLNVRYKGPGIGDGSSFVEIPDAALLSGTFIPPPPPAAPTAVSANGVGMQQVNITWQFTDDASTDYEVYRSSMEAGPFEIVTRAKGLSAVDSIGLVPGTPYFYKIKTVNNEGSSAFSPVATATTQGDNVTPTVPQELLLISKTLTNVAFSWKPSADNIGVTAYEIFSGDELIGTSTIHAFTAEHLSPNTQYSFTVKAVDASGNRSAASAALSVATNTSAVFYSMASGNLNELSTWHRNPDGTGESPASFSDNGQDFIVTNRTATSMGGPWTIGGSASRIIISPGVTFTADHPLSGQLELQGNAVLILNHAVPPHIAKVSPTSTVNFIAPPAIMKNTYGNVILSGTTIKTFDADTVTILGNLTVNEGLALKGSSHNSSFIWLAGSITLAGARPETPADNTVNVAFTSGTTQSITTESDIHLYRISTAANQILNVINPSDTPISINLGSLNGGGLSLANGSVLNIHNHNLYFHGAALANSGSETGQIATNGGDLHFSSTNAGNSNLFFESTHYVTNRVDVDLTGGGSLNIRSPLHVTDGIKIRSGTLASDGNVTLVATADRAAVIDEIENGGKITGDVNVQQPLDANGNVYHYIAAPVSGLNVAQWQESFPITGLFSGASAGFGTSPSLFHYAQSGWVAHPPAGGSNTAVIQKGLGYAALMYNGMQPVIIKAKGNPYQGSVAFPLAAGSAGVSDKGWNLVGNPFASPVVWKNEEGAWTRSGVNNVAAVRENTIVNGQARSQVTYYDVALGGGVIPAGHAFWVKTFSASPALSIQETAKVNPEEEPAMDEFPVKHLVVNLKQGDLVDPAYILFTEEGTDDFDPQLDGRKLPNYGMFNFSTRTSDTVSLAVNNVTHAFCSKTIHLNIEDVLPGSYSFSFENIESLNEVGEILLVDHFAATSTAITGAEYAFSVTEDPKSFGRERFSITFSKEEVDLTSPSIEATDICAPGPGYVIVSNTQDGVLYEVLNEAGDVISARGEGTGEDIELEIMTDKLVTGANKVTITAGFMGCDRLVLPGEVTLNFVTDLTIETEGDVSICEGADVTLEVSGAPVGGYYKWFDSNGVVIEGMTTSTLVVSDVFTEAVYYVAAAHPNGCESELAEIHIYPDTLDMPVIEMKDDTLFTSIVAYYQWRKDGVDISGANLSYYVPTENGKYTVVASNEGCFRESEPYQFGDPITGIDNGNNSEFVLSIYPVPTNGKSINVSLRSPKTEPVLIEIIDALGRLHFRQTIDAGTLVHGTDIVPYAPLYNGIYFLRATQADIKARKKIIVKN